MPAAILLVVVTLATEEPTALQLLIALVVVGGTIVYAKIGWDLRQFRPWARGITIVFSIPSLAGFPIGTILSAYILYVLLHPRSSVVFSARYRKIMRQTPEIWLRPSIATWLLVILGPILLCGAFYGAFWMHR